MADKRNYEWPDASTYNGYITQDKSGGSTERVSVAQVENRLVADGFAKTDQIPAASSASPADLAASAAAGASSDFARADHAHKKPSPADIGAAAASHSHAQSDVTGLSISLTNLQSGIDGKLDEASPTVVSGPLSLAQSGASAPSLQIPTSTTSPSTPATGDVWADASRSFFHGRIFAVTKDAANGFGGGSAFSLMDAASPTKGAHIQLNASGGMDIWTLQSGTWTKELTLPIDGSIQLANLAGTGTRQASLDSSGKVVSVAQPDYFHGSWSSGASTLTDITDWAEPLSDDAHYKCFVAGKLTSSTATETRFKFIIGGVSTSTVVVYSKGDWAVSFDVTTIGGSGASVCAVISSYGSFVTKHFEISSPSYVSASGIRLQIASDDDSAEIQGLCTRLERLQ